MAPSPPSCSPPDGPRLSPRFRLLPLASDVALARADQAIEPLSELPGVLKAGILHRNRALILQYDLGYVCLAFLECWLEDNGVGLNHGYYMEPMHVAVHHAERRERRLLLGSLVEEIPCGTPNAHIRLASLGQQRTGVRPHQQCDWSSLRPYLAPRR